MAPISTPFANKHIITCSVHAIYSGDLEIGPPMGLTESDSILESGRFVKPATFELRDTSQSVYR